MNLRFRLNDLKLFYQIVFGLIPIHLPEYITFADPSRVRYTRNTSAIIEHRDTTTLCCNVVPGSDGFRNSYFYRTLRLWNNLPISVRQVGGISLFKTRLVRYLWSADTDWPD